ncbi:MAG: hypothetical protein Q7R41_16150, partial [Phycisphaerales bacterium]|nr:hypothetical protein [Phycisphaerales bacterium]
TVGAEANCTGGGGDFQGNGTDCDADNGHDAAEQHCCPQPLFTGADNCEDVVFHILALPPQGDSRTITITGNNTTATYEYGEYCCGPNEDCYFDFGWREGFDIPDCAMVRIDYCCTDPVKRPVTALLFDSCPCASRILSTPNPYKFPEPQYASGAPYCDDENLWATFGPLPGGHYYIPIASYLPGSFGEYQLHITAEACPLAACCVIDSCVDGVNQLECDALGGVFLAPPQEVPAVEDCSGDPCATGTCCVEPGACMDRNGSAPITKAYCDSVNGAYSGGVTCHGGTCSNDSNVSCAASSDCPQNAACNGTPQQLAQPTRCPICELETVDNCQMLDLNSRNFTLSDRHLTTTGLLAADDFTPTGQTLSSVCVWGFYLNGDPDAPPVEFDCSPFVLTDQFRVRVFNNGPTGRMPGTLVTLVGESTATSRRAIVPGSFIDAIWEAKLYGYQLVLDTEITLTIGNTYWLEVSNDAGV